MLSPAIKFQQRLFSEVQYRQLINQSLLDFFKRRKQVFVFSVMKLFRHRRAHAKQRALPARMNEAFFRRENITFVIYVSLPPQKSLSMIGAELPQKNFENQGHFAIACNSWIVWSVALLVLLNRVS